MGDLEVRHADAACPAVPCEFLQHVPCGDEVTVIQSRQRPMNQKQVNVIRASALNVASKARRASSGR